MAELPRLGRRKNQRKPGSLEFYDRTRAGEGSSSNLRALERKGQCFSIFYYVNMSTKSKTVNFLEFTSVKFRKIWQTVNKYFTLFGARFPGKFVRQVFWQR